jgi:phospholipase C
MIVLLVSGCGVSNTSSGTGTTAAPTVSIAAAPTSVTVGSSSTLTVSATNATSVTVTGSDGTKYTMAAAGGTEAITPSTTTTYTATATGSGGTASATATVTVAGTATPAPTVSISASPTSVTANSSSTLTVSVTNATTVTVAGSDGSSYTLPATGGTQVVTPATTTTYTATATGSGGTASSQAMVTVTANPAPSVTLTASPTSITAANSSLLTVKALNATEVTLTGSDGSSYTLAPSGGTQAVSPAATTTYTVLATGPGGQATSSVIVTVTPNPPPTVTMTANPASVTAGTPSTLSVNATNATSVTIKGSDGSSYTLASSNVSQSVTPATTTTYVATATGPGGTSTAMATVTVTAVPTPSVTITASPSTIVASNTSTLTVTASNATSVTIAGTDNSSYTLPNSGGTQIISPTTTTTYTVTAVGQGGQAVANTTVTVDPGGSVDAVDHVVFMLQENHTFDNYFGMLNPYREQNGWTTAPDGNTYSVDGIADKLSTISNSDDEGTAFPLFPLTSTCIDDETSSWLESYGQVNRYDFSSTRSINMDGFVHTAENFAKNCNAGTGQCAGTFSDFTGQRAMGYYDQSFLNYYYYMASQFALSDRWFSPVSSKSISNRIATFTGGTTQGLVFDPGVDDHLNTQLNIPTIFQELDQAGVSWKIYYTVTQGGCLEEDDCPVSGNSNYPATDFSSLAYSYQYLYVPQAGQACAAPTQPSSVVGDASNSFCIDPDHIAPLSQYYTDLANGTLPSFSFIEAGYGVNDEHPGSGQSILMGQAEVAKVVNAFMNSPEWKDSIFFLAYDEGGGPYDHVPPVPGHSNDNTDPVLGSDTVADIPDISTIAVNPDGFNPCLPPTIGTPTTHCDLASADPGANAADAAAMQGFAAQLGFRVPNMVISPFTREHYVSHIPMDHTAIIKFVEDRFIGPSAHLTARDAAQPNLLNFFNFTSPSWETPPVPPTPYTDPSGQSSCTPASFAPAASTP